MMIHSSWTSLLVTFYVIWGGHGLTRSLLLSCSPGDCYRQEDTFFCVINSACTSPKYKLENSYICLKWKIKKCHCQKCYDTVDDSSDNLPLKLYCRIELCRSPYMRQKCPHVCDSSDNLPPKRYCRIEWCQSPYIQQKCPHVCAGINVTVTATKAPRLSLAEFGCYNGKGENYLGLANISLNDKICLDWQDGPQEFRNSKFPDGTLSLNAKNYCRNPGGFRLKPWCYVQIFGSKYPQDCAVPKCQNDMKGRDCYNEDFGADYNGTISYPGCVSWFQVVQESLFDSITKSAINTNLPDGNIRGAENFCRNPTNDITGPHCYTFDEETKAYNKKRCTIPKCSDASQQIKFPMFGSPVPEGQKKCSFPGEQLIEVSFSLQTPYDLSHSQIHRLFNLSMFTTYTFHRATHRPPGPHIIDSVDESDSWSDDDEDLERISLTQVIQGGKEKFEATVKNTFCASSNPKMSMPHCLLMLGRTVQEGGENCPSNYDERKLEVNLPLSEYVSNNVTFLFQRSSTGTLFYKLCCRAMRLSLIFNKIEVMEKGDFYFLSPDRQTCEKMNSESRGAYTMNSRSLVWPYSPMESVSLLTWMAAENKDVIYKSYNDLMLCAVKRGKSGSQSQDLSALPGILTRYSCSNDSSLVEAGSFVQNSGTQYQLCLSRNGSAIVTSSLFDEISACFPQSITPYPCPAGLKKAFIPENNDMLRSMCCPTGRYHPGSRLPTLPVQLPEFTIFRGDGMCPSFSRYLLHVQRLNPHRTLPHSNPLASVDLCTYVLLNGSSIFIAVQQEKLVDGCPNGTEKGLLMATGTVQIFCTSPVSVQAKWPPGSYCVNVFSFKCPPGFASASQTIDGYGSRVASGLTSPILYQCCRIDGSAMIPIALPIRYSNSSFYLPKRGFNCQTLKGYRVKYFLKSCLYIRLTVSERITVLSVSRKTSSTVCSEYFPSVLSNEHYVVCSTLLTIRSLPRAHYCFLTISLCPITGFYQKVIISEKTRERVCCTNYPSRESVVPLSNSTVSFAWEMEESTNIALLKKDDKPCPLLRDFHILRSSLVSYVHNVTSEVVSVTTCEFTRDPIIMWPKAPFALPKPFTGCSKGFQEGSMWHEIKELKNGLQFSKTLHLDGVFTAGHSLFQWKFCSRDGDPNKGRNSWQRSLPTGSYCVFRSKKTCPNYFQPGTLEFLGALQPSSEAWLQTFNETSENGVLPDIEVTPNGSVIYNFCCQRDVMSANVEVFFPDQKDPFYLMRESEEKCQSILGKSVTEENICLPFTVRADRENLLTKVEGAKISGLTPVTFSTEPDACPVRINFCAYRPENWESIDNQWIAPPDQTGGLNSTSADGFWPRGYYMVPRSKYGLCPKYLPANAYTPIGHLCTAFMYGPREYTQWPSGSYCIIIISNTRCPLDFILRSEIMKSHSLWLCCRNDANVRRMTLPWQGGPVTFVKPLESENCMPAKDKIVTEEYRANVSLKLCTYHDLPHNKSSMWPPGDYYLPEDDWTSSCPFQDFERYTLKLKDPLQVSNQTFKSNEIPVCRRKNTTESQGKVRWPSGNYCLFSTTHCPANPHDGMFSARLKGRVQEFSQSSGNFNSSMAVERSTDLFFCCMMRQNSDSLFQFIADTNDNHSFILLSPSTNDIVFQCPTIWGKQSQWITNFPFMKNLPEGSLLGLLDLLSFDTISLQLAHLKHPFQSGCRYVPEHCKCSQGNEVCVLIESNYTCQCKWGYRRDSRGICRKIGECGCPENSFCDKENSYQVTCPCFPGYHPFVSRSGEKKCFSACEKDCGQFGRCVYLVNNITTCECFNGSIPSEGKCYGTIQQELTPQHPIVNFYNNHAGCFPLSSGIITGTNSVSFNQSAVSIYIRMMIPIAVFDTTFQRPIREILSESLTQDKILLEQFEKNTTCELAQKQIAVCPKIDWRCYNRFRSSQYQQGFRILYDREYANGHLVFTLIRANKKWYDAGISAGWKTFLVLLTVVVVCGSAGIIFILARRNQMTGNFLFRRSQVRQSLQGNFSEVSNDFTIHDDHEQLLH